MLNPEVSILMSVYNTNEQWLIECIESVLNQSFRNFEFIIILDNPTDRSVDIVRKYAILDDRIIMLLNTENKGLTKNLHDGVLMSRGRYIARIDSDDICFLNRIEKQFNFMEKHQNVAVLGSYVDSVNENGCHIVNMNNCSNNIKKNKVKMMFCNAGVVHSTAFIRKDFLLAHGLNYDVRYKKAQDYALWCDIVLKAGIIQCIHHPLVTYRIHAGQITNTFGMEQKTTFKCKIKDQLMVLFQDSYNDSFLDTHMNLLLCDTSIEIAKYKKYIKLCLENNKKHKILSRYFLNLELKYRFTKLLFSYPNRKRHLIDILTMLLNPFLFIYILKIKISDFWYLKRIKTVKG